MADKEKGSGKWISSIGGGGGLPYGREHDENCSGLHSTSGYCVPTEENRQRGEREKARINRNAGAIRSLLKDHSLASIGTVRGGSLDDDDRAELLERLDKDLEAMPKKIRPELREAGEAILNFIGDGNRQSAWTLADEVARSTALEVPAAWSPSNEDEPSPEDLIADIPR